MLLLQCLMFNKYFGSYNVLKFFRRVVATPRVGGIFLSRTVPIVYSFNSFR